MAYRNISMADLITVPGFLEAYGNDDKEALKGIYHSLGFDVNKDTEWRYCTHRKANNEIVTCERLEGYERIDREWLESGFCSYEGKIDSYEDIGFRVELRKMLHIQCVDMAFEDNGD